MTDRLKNERPTASAPNSGSIDLHMANEAAKHRSDCSVTMPILSWGWMILALKENHLTIDMGKEVERQVNQTIADLTSKSNVTGDLQERRINDVR